MGSDYNPQTWHNYPATDTPISAERLTVIEEGIRDHDHGAGGSWELALDLSAVAEAPPDTFSFPGDPGAAFSFPTPGTIVYTQALDDDSAYGIMPFNLDLVDGAIEALAVTGELRTDALFPDGGSILKVGFIGGLNAAVGDVDDQGVNQIFAVAADPTTNRHIDLEIGAWQPFTVVQGAFASLIVNGERTYWQQNSWSPPPQLEVYAQEIQASARNLKIYARYFTLP